MDTLCTIMNLRQDELQAILKQEHIMVAGESERGILFWIDKSYVKGQLVTTIEKQAVGATIDQQSRRQLVLKHRKSDGFHYDFCVTLDTNKIHL